MKQLSVSILKYNLDILLPSTSKNYALNNWVWSRKNSLPSVFSEASESFSSPFSSVFSSPFLTFSVSFSGPSSTTTGWSSSTCLDFLHSSTSL